MVNNSTFRRLLLKFCKSAYFLSADFAVLSRIFPKPLYRRENQYFSDQSKNPAEIIIFDGKKINCFYIGNGNVPKDVF